MYQYILFDLDGTLTNPKEGITKSIQYALRHFGIDVEDLDSLEKHIGPPLKEAFRDDWKFNEEDTANAIRKYREYFSVTGIFENKEYEGVKELLQMLEQGGKKLILATSKPEVFAKQILDYFELSQYFTDICGNDLEGSRESKGDVIRYALEKNQITELDRVVMVGDRRHDIEGAAENGIASIGVLYGFGSRQELERAGAGQIAESVDDLERILLDRI